VLTEQEELQLSYDHQIEVVMEKTQHTILYKKDTKGKIRTLEMWTEDNELVQLTGLLDGAKVEARSVCTGKNAGKKNETTGAMQAIKELKSKVTKKLREGYFESLEDAKTISVEKPMLAHEYEKHKKKIKGGMWVQPKLDGQRAKGKAGSTYELYSRNNKKIETMHHITKALAGLQLVLDGELYAHGVSFQDNMKLIKKYRPGESEKVCWHVYDIQMDAPYSDRQHLLLTWYERQSEEVQKVVKLVPSYICENEEELKERHIQFLKEGYEGTMVRHGNKPYKVNGRCDQLLKYKDFIDITATLVDVIPEERRPEFGKAVCKAINEDGKEIEFLAAFKASHAERTEYLANKDNYIGQTCEIRFFEWTTSVPAVPRFPVCVGFRNDK
jgi:DNA ligase-1